MIGTSQIVRITLTTVISLSLFLSSFEGKAQDENQNLGTVGYFCQVRFTPSSGSFGDKGHILSILWSQKNCGGSYVGHRYFCSEGASSSYCPSSAGYLYNGNEILSLFKAIQNYAVSGNRVIVQGGENAYTCSHKYCGAVVDFYGN